MSSPTRYVKGQWKTVCDVCGMRYDSSQLQMRWDGLMVCNKDWEPRQPQDFVRAKVDIQAVPWTRTESTDYTFVIDSTTKSAVAGVAVAGIAIAGFALYIDTVPPGTFTP